MPLATRFWARVQRAEGDACWLWLGVKDRKGYGRITLGTKNLKAHRVSFELANGRLDDGMLICHRCDNPSCVRPDHLFAGTASDNMRDAVRKGRLAGIRNIHRRSESQVA